MRASEASHAASTGTYMMSAGSRRSQATGPTIARTCGQRPACLVNASLTYCGNDTIYAFGGFDQYSDEVYNHVLRLDLKSLQWSLVENSGSVPAVRMGHTATLWKDSKLLVYGGENEYRDYLSDVIIFDLTTRMWHRPQIEGFKPRGRARHAAALYNDRLFVIGGLAKPGGRALDEICYLDLHTWTWSPTWTFVARFDHTACVWNDRLWVYGGLGSGMERTSDIWYLDLSANPAFKAPPPATSVHRSNSAQIRSEHTTKVPAGPITAIHFQSGPNVPNSSVGTHFSAFTSGSLLDFSNASCSENYDIAMLSLQSLQWTELTALAKGSETSYVWNYCILDNTGTRAWLLGCAHSSPDALGEGYLSDVLCIDLDQYGVAGHGGQKARGLSADLATMFDSENSGHDFLVTACEDDGEGQMSCNKGTVSAPIRVHRLILQARWPHFHRLYGAEMAEFHSRKLHIPEPVSIVRAFLQYLYTDSIDDQSLGIVAGLLVMAHTYDLQWLRTTCLGRLSQELDVEHAAMVWQRAGLAANDWLQQRAAQFCLQHWGRVVRTAGFRRLSRAEMASLCEVVDLEGRVVVGEELSMLEAAKSSPSGPQSRSLSRTATEETVVNLDDSDHDPMPQDDW